MLKYIGKKLFLRLFAFILLSFVLYSFFKPNEFWANIEIAMIKTPYDDGRILVPIENRMAVYYPTKSRTGLAVTYLNSFEHDGETYCTSVISPLHTIIRRDDALHYTPYRFSHFLVKTDAALKEDIAKYKEDSSAFTYNPANYDFSPYIFGDVLENIYGISSSREIKSVEHSLTNSKSGTNFDKEDINAFYDVISRMECVGIDADDMHWAGTRIKINFRNGISIDRLRYSRANNTISFYYPLHMSYIKIFTAHLTEADKSAVEYLIYHS